MKWSLFLLSVLCLPLNCTSPKAETGGTFLHDAGQERADYYSDYFVFLSDDALPDLIVPMDINWKTSQKGYSYEYKAWYGGDWAWPISYETGEVEKQGELPDEWWELKSSDSFQMDEERKECRLFITGVPEISFDLPRNEEWKEGFSRGRVRNYACRWSITSGGVERRGWLIYERIRLKAAEKRNFGRFHWIPLVYHHQLYHVVSSEDESQATNWFLKGDSLYVKSTSDFSLSITGSESDSASQRQSIPTQLRISIPVWDLDLEMHKTGGQVGYGAEFSKGLAYYRQSMLRSIDPPGAYGMWELILED